MKKATEISMIKSVTEAPGAECGGCANYKIKGFDLAGNRIIEVKVSTRRNADDSFRAEIAE